MNVEGQAIFMNSIKTPTQEKKDEPLVKAFGELKKSWQGTKESLKIKLKDRAIEVQGVKIVTQREGELQIVWRIPREEVVDEERVRIAIAKKNAAS